MNVRFHEPSPSQRAGGLDAAIRGMQSALAKLGHTVAVDPAAAAADAVHFHGLWQPAFPALARRYCKMKVPVVVSPHGMLEPWAWRHKWWKKFPYWHLIERRWVSRAALVLATAESEARRLAEFLPRTKIATLPLGLTGDARPDYAAARAKLGWADAETVLLFLSRIHEKKGLDLLLSALAQQRLPSKTRLIIVGPEEQPAYAAKCRAFVECNAGRLPVAEWRGAVWGEERWPYLQGADLFCLPSHSENFGLVVLEACQTGTPVLFTTGTPWAGTLAERGYSCEPEVQSIRGALDRYFAAPRQSPVQRTALADWAWANFHWDALAPRYAELYASL
jgi:glycosyltransferase involved in cell wall biosynthesis